MKSYLITLVLLLSLTSEAYSFVFLKDKIFSDTLSTQSIISKDTSDIIPFNQGFIMNPLLLIQGRIAGMNMIQTDGRFNSPVHINLQGFSSLSGIGSTPMIVIDGFPLYHTNIYLHPQDIESITVQNNFTSAPEFQQNANLGIIYITTKKGTNKTSISYSSKLSYSSFNTDKYNIFSPSEFRELITDKYGSASTEADKLGKENINWLNEVFENSFSQDHHLNIASTINPLSLPFRISASTTDANGVLKEQSNYRKTASFTTNPTYFKDHLKLFISGGLLNEGERYINDLAIFSAIQMNPTQSYESYEYPDERYNLNPSYYFDKDRRNANIDQKHINIKALYNFHYLPEFSFEIQHSGNHQKQNYNYISLESNTSGDMVHKKSEIDDKLSYNKIALNYSKRFNSKSELNTTIGYSSIENKGTKRMATANSLISSSINYSIDENYLEFTSIDYSSSRKSLYGIFNYNLKGKYLFSLDFSKINYPDLMKGKKENSHGLGISWNMHEEFFPENLNLLNKATLRLNYGKTHIWPWMNSNTANPVNEFEERPSVMYDPNLNLEEVKSLIIGADFGLFNNRLTGYFEYYQKKSEDLLTTMSLPSSINGPGLYINNKASLKTCGVNISLNGLIINSENIKWNIETNIAFQKSIIELPNDISIIEYQDRTALANGEEFPSFYFAQQLYNNNGTPIELSYKNQDNDPIINYKDYVNSGSPFPKTITSLSSWFKYKNWTLSFLGRANFGNKNHNRLNTYSTFSNINSTYLSNATKSVLHSNFETNHYYTMSDYFVENASFFKLDYIALKHSLTNLLNSHLDIDISAIAQNIFTLTNYSGVDPEVLNGYDLTQYPRPKIYTLQLDVRF